MRRIFSVLVLTFVVFFNSIELSSQAEKDSSNNEFPPPNAPLLPGRHRLAARRPEVQGLPPRPEPPYPRPNCPPIPEQGPRNPGVSVQEEYFRRRGHRIIHNPNQLENPGARRQLFEGNEIQPRPHHPNSPNSSIGSNDPEI